MTTRNPLVSIITPSYNHRRFIQATIESVLSQNYPNIEYLIIDGGSTDGTPELLQSYADRLQWISERDQGQCDAINKGFRMARGEIVAWLNSDDTYCPGGLCRAVDHLVSHPELAMVYGRGYEIDESGQVIQEFPAAQAFDYWRLVYLWDYILQPTVFMRREALFKVGLLDLDLNWAMDWDLWLRFAARYPIGYLPVPIANSRIHGQTKTSVGGFPRLREILKVMRRHGSLRYPPGFFVYAQDTIQGEIKARFPSVDGPVFQRLMAYACQMCWRRVHRAQGLFPDGWVSRRANFVFAPHRGSAVQLRGEIPEFAKILPIKIEIRLRGQRSPLGCEVVERPGPFCLTAPLPEDCGPRADVEVRSNHSFCPRSRGLGGDPRNLSFMLRDISLV